MNPVLVPILTFLAALFLLSAVATGISLKRHPHMMAGYVVVALLILLVIAYTHHGHEPLEGLDVCTPPASAQPRAPQPTANLQGCPNYHPGYLPGSDPLPASQRVGLNADGTRPTPLWANNP